MSWTLDHVGVHGRSADDCARLLAAACGAEAELAEEIARPAEFDDLIDAPIAALALGDLPISASARKAYEAAIERARLLGMDVEEITLTGYDFADAFRLGALISGAESMAEHAARLAVSEEGFSKGYLAAMARGADMKASLLAAAYRDLARYAEAARAALGPYQGLILPVTPGPAFRFEDGQGADIALYTSLANIVGLPAMSAPFGLDENGLPLAIQTLAWDDETALGLGKALADYPGAPTAWRG
jgi:aspartyl-tRNA(Asn)/glutamyl-tRNA(Gln) amidotransferase subunit A